MLELNTLMENIDLNNETYQSHKDKNLYGIIRKDIIRIHSLHKSEYTYYYAMVRERTIPEDTN